jgi:hypothetical protein
MTRSWVFIATVCPVCREASCVCRAPVSVTCQCGAILTATDELEAKNRAHALHVRTERHQAWQGRR